MLGHIVAGEIDRSPLCSIQFINNLFFVGAKLFGDRRKLGGELGAVRLVRQGLSPVQGQVEVGASVVELVDLTTGALTLGQNLASGFVKTLSQYLTDKMRCACVHACACECVC